MKLNPIRIETQIEDCLFNMDKTVEEAKKMQYVIDNLCNITKINSKRAYNIRIDNNNIYYYLRRKSKTEYYYPIKYAKIEF